MQLYEYVIWIDERLNKDDEVVESAVIISEPKVMVAKDDKVAAMRAAREVPVEYDDKLDRVQIVVRPF